MLNKKELAVVSLSILSALSLTISNPTVAFAKESKNNSDVESKADSKNDKASNKDSNSDEKSGEELKKLKKSRVVEFIKYFNPIPNDSYTNESQDRVIKKKRFKFVEVPGASPVVNPELGYFAILPLDKFDDQEKIEALLNRKDVNGLSVIIPWQHLEPNEFKYDWKELDSLINTVKKFNKKLIVRVSTCGLDNRLESDTPGWVFEAGAKSIEFFGTDGEKHKMPIFWDSTYLAKWSNFVNALGDRYDKNDSLHSVGITGGGILGATRVIPNFVTLKKVKEDDSKDDSSDKSKKDEQEKTSKTDEQKGKNEESIDSKAKTPVDKESEEKDSDSKEKKTSSSKEDEASDSAKDKASTSKEEKTESVEVDDDDNEPEFEVESEPSRKNYKRLYKKLKKEFGMSERQLVGHWKYVADIFPGAFKATRLNFDVSAPVKGGKGQSALDEISDYLVYRYGQRIYLTRQNVVNARHGFNQYRVLLKFHYDTVTGFRLSPDFKVKDFDKLAKIALIDGISYMELPIEFIESKEETIKTALAKIYSHLGYQLVSRKVTMPKDLKVGESLKTSFTFVNLGSACALNPKRDLDKDTATSYKIQLEFRNAKGRPVMRSLHTPDLPTNKWRAGKPIIWEEELKMSPKLEPGKYDVYMSLIDHETKHKLKFLNELEDGKVLAGTDFSIGTVELIQ